MISSILSRVNSLVAISNFPPGFKMRRISSRVDSISKICSKISIAQTVSKKLSGKSITPLSSDTVKLISGYLLVAFLIAASEISTP